MAVSVPNAFDATRLLSSDLKTSFSTEITEINPSPSESPTSATFNHGILYVDENTNQLTSHNGSEYAIISPYNHLENMLELDRVEIQCGILALALIDMNNTTPAYATESYDKSFNWDTALENIRRLSRERNHTWTAQRFYAVTFRSRVPLSTDRSRLSLLDFKAHQEAVTSGGLLKYWFGSPDAVGRNLATCIWRNPTDAKKGGTGPWHRQAMTETRHLYQEWRFERWAFTITDDAEGWSIQPWTDNEQH
jgi:hypothetical protein